MEEEEINNSDEWLDEVDEMVFNIKRKVHSWLKETNEDDIDVKRLHQRQRVTQV